MEKRDPREREQDANALLSTIEGGVGLGGLTSLLVAMSFGGHFGQPANRRASADRAVRSLSTDARQLAWVGQKGHQNGLVMAILLCHGESGSGVLFHGCVLAIIGYTRCRVNHTNNIQTLP